MRVDGAPLIGALAVVLQNGCVLLIERGTDPHFGCWSLPGGVIDDGESVEEAAVRETLEETGLEVAVVRGLGVVTGPITGRGHGVFLCSMVEGALKTSPPEVTDVRWIPYDDLSGILVPGFIRKLLEGIDLVALETES